MTIIIFHTFFSVEPLNSEHGMILVNDGHG